MTNSANLMTTMRPLNQCVYVAGSERWIKIGHTSDPAGRVSGLRSPDGDRTSVMHITECGWPFAKHAENEIHRSLRGPRTKDAGLFTEWYRRDLLDVDSVVKLIERQAAMSMKNIGKRIEKTRFERDQTQMQVARHLGVSQAVMSLIIDGRRTPSDELLTKIESWLANDGIADKAPRGAQGGPTVKAKRGPYQK